MFEKLKEWWKNFKFAGDGWRNIVTKKDLLNRDEIESCYSYKLVSINYKNIHCFYHRGVICLKAKAIFKKYSLFFPVYDENGVRTAGLVKPDHEGYALFTGTKFILFPAMRWDIEDDIYSTYCKKFDLWENTSIDYFKTYYLPNEDWEKYPVEMCDSYYLRNTM